MKWMPDFQGRFWRLRKRTRAPRVYVFGDSHTAAILRALAYEGHSTLNFPLSVLRLRKNKGGETVGDESVERFCKRIARLGSTDHVFSAVGGNQYAVVSTLKHEFDFTILSRGERVQDSRGERQHVVPRRAFQGLIECEVENSDGLILRRIRDATSANVHHLSPPPPKSDNNFLLQCNERFFSSMSVCEFVPTEPKIRLECWKMQQRSLEMLCQSIGISLVAPPTPTMTSEGFLIPDCYHGDITHANRRYGRWVLKQISTIVNDGVCFK